MDNIHLRNNTPRNSQALQTCWIPALSSQGEVEKDRALAFLDTHHFHTVIQPHGNLKINIKR